MTASRLPIGRCRLCGHRRALHIHRSRRDGLMRLTCTPCWSAATVTEEAGREVEWQPGLTDGTDPVDGGLW